jgi:hypothetical protein
MALLARELAHSQQWVCVAELGAGFTRHKPSILVVTEKIPGVNHMTDGTHVRWNASAASLVNNAMESEKTAFLKSSRWQDASQGVPVMPAFRQFPPGLGASGKRT